MACVFIGQINQGLMLACPVCTTLTESQPQPDPIGYSGRNYTLKRQRRWILSSASSHWLWTAPQGDRDFRHFSFPNALEQVPEGHRCESLAAKHRDVGKGIPRDPGGRRKKRLEFFILIKNHIRLTAAVITGEMDLVLKINIVAQAT